MSLTVDSNLLFADDIPLLPTLLYRKIEQFVTKSHSVGEVAHFLSHYQNLEILSSVNIRDET